MQLTKWVEQTHDIIYWLLIYNLDNEYFTYRAVASILAKREPGTAWGKPTTVCRLMTDLPGYSHLYVLLLELLCVKSAHLDQKG